MALMLIHILAPDPKNKEVTAVIVDVTTVVE